MRIKPVVPLKHRKGEEDRTVKTQRIWQSSSLSLGMSALRQFSKCCLQQTSQWTVPVKMCFRMVCMLSGACCLGFMPWRQILGLQMHQSHIHGLFDCCQVLHANHTPTLNSLQFKSTRIMHHVHTWTKTTWEIVWSLAWATIPVAIFGSMMILERSILSCKRTFRACITMRQALRTLDHF